MRQQCSEAGCDKQACFNYDGIKVDSYCKEHKKPNMIDIKNRRCNEDGCYKQPRFNIRGIKSGIYCKEHKKPNMIDVTMRGCTAPDCDKKPCFNIPGSAKGIYCKQHAEPSMVDVVNRKCREDGCYKQPQYGVGGTLTALFCKEHKKKEHVDITHEKCKESGCNTRPQYAMDGSKKGIYCKEHAEPDMVYITKNKCKYQGCNKQPQYGNRGIVKGIYCREHKESHMIDVMHPRCGNKSCDKSPNFNYLGETRGAYCKEHAMINMVDVKHTLCKTGNCDTRASYGIAGNAPIRCAKHKEKNMLLNPRKQCTDANCYKIAIYGKTKHERCEDHKYINDINFIESECKSCGLLGVLNAGKMCYYCEPTNFKKYALSKQLEVKAILDANNYKYVSYDKIINRGECGKERPDFLFDCDNRYVVLEVDEHQHMDRNCECEQTRMVNICQSLGMPTTFIRFNPDTYKVNNHNIKTPVATRMEEVCKWINTLTARVNNKAFLTTVYLFFDDYENDAKEYVILRKNKK
jgi:hypothetical protein